METKFEDLIFAAGICERADRYDDMIEAMKQVIDIADKQRIDQPIKIRNLFSVAYKNQAGSARTSWRILSTELLKHEKQKDNKYLIVKNYMKETENKLNNICDDVLQTIDEKIINSVTFSDDESKVFFLKMKGDYLRYKAEVCDDDKEEFDKISNESCACYNKARDVAMGMKSTNPVRLGLALNYSVYLYEIAKDCKGACEIAKLSFDEAIAGLDELSEDHYKDSTLIMQLLRDNMTLWTNQEESMQNDDEAEEGFVEGSQEEDKEGQ